MKRSKKRKRFIFWGGVGVVVVVALVVVFCTQNKGQKMNLLGGAGEMEEELVGWQEYSSEANPISFKYPPDWELEVIEESSVSFKANLHKEDTSQEQIEVYTEKMYPKYSINISTMDNPKGLTAEEYYLDWFGESSRARAKADIEAVEYGGLKGISYPEAVAPSSGPGYGVLLSTGDGQHIYQFVHSALATKESHEKYRQVYESFLKSLKFE